MCLVKVVKLSIASLVCVLVFWTVSSFAAVKEQGNSLSLEATMIKGEVYVKASSLVEQIGGSGSYNAKTQTYTLDMNQGIPQLVKEVSPSVVAIIGKPKADPYQKIDRFALSHGTGVIITEDGWIVTNAHVVENMKDMVVVTSSEKQYAAKKVILDKASDLALVKINAAGLRAASFGDSNKVEVGETVIAIGTPISFALRNSATVGVISGQNRSVHSSYRLLQTDTAINPGNSGGPLVNLEGQVIGINSMKFVDVSVDNMGFSIPAETVSYVIHHLKTYGKVKRPYLGFEVEESWEAVIGLSTSKPLTITRVESDSNAAKQGISTGDLLYTIDGEKVVTLVDLTEKLKQYMPGDKVNIKFMSSGNLTEKTIVLHEKQ